MSSTTRKDLEPSEVDRPRESSRIHLGSGDILETVSRVFSLLLAGTIAFHLTSQWSM